MPAVIESIDQKPCRIIEHVTSRCNERSNILIVGLDASIITFDNPLAISGDVIGVDAPDSLCLAWEGGIRSDFGLDDADHLMLSESRFTLGYQFRISTILPRRIRDTSPDGKDGRRDSDGSCGDERRQHGFHRTPILAH